MLKKGPAILFVSRMVVTQDVHLGGTVAFGGAGWLLAAVLWASVCPLESVDLHDAEEEDLLIGVSSGVATFLPEQEICRPLPSWRSSSLSLCPMCAGMGLPPIRVPITPHGGAF